MSDIIVYKKLNTIRGIILQDKTPEILRALRKYYGINQVQLSQIIGVSQGTMSKLEAGILDLSATQWVFLCQKYNLDPTIISTGRIEAFDNIKINPNSSEKFGNFKINKRYQYLMGSTNRAVYPFVKFLERKAGEKKTQEFFKAIKVDRDYFTIQNLPINILIIEDIFNYLIKLGLVSTSNVGEILNMVPASEVHEHILSQLNKNAEPDRNFKKFTKSISDLYEVNSEYTFEGDKDCYIKVRNNAHLSELELSSDFSLFRESYNLSHFNKLSPLFLSNYQFETSQQTQGWDIKVIA